MKTLSTILNKEFDFKAVHIGLFLTDELHPFDKWVITIEGQTFDYSQGIGFRVSKHDYASEKDKFRVVMGKNPKKERTNMERYLTEVNTVSKVVAPKLDDVLNCLILDSSFASEMFEDFCSSLGYSSDSIKAFNIYQDCQKNAIKLRTFIKDLNEAVELFQNY